MEYRQKYLKNPYDPYEIKLNRHNAILTLKNTRKSLIFAFSVFFHYGCLLFRKDVIYF